MENIKTYAVIEAGAVVNLILADPAAVADLRLVVVDVTDADVRIGDTYNGATFTRP